MVPSVGRGTGEQLLAGDITWQDDFAEEIGGLAGEMTRWTKRLRIGKDQEFRSPAHTQKEGAGGGYLELQLS